MSTGQLDHTIHQPTRLRIVAALYALPSDAQVDFSYLRDQLQLTDGNLGAHLAKLEAGSYIELEKVFVKRMPRTYIHLTGHGRDAFERHVEALRRILNSSDDAPNATP